VGSRRMRNTVGKPISIDILLVQIRLTINDLQESYTGRATLPARVRLPEGNRERGGVLDWLVLQPD